MSLLLDTNVILWWLLDDPTLTDEMKTRLDEEPDVFYSPISVWEVTIKQAKGKLPGPADLAEQIRDSGFVEMPVAVRHFMAAGRLPLHHNDPFDRMLIAQAIAEGLVLVSRDSTMQKYGVEFLHV